MKQNSFEARKPFLLENEGSNLFGVLHLPEKTRVAPVVLFFHGLGGNKVGRYRLFVELAERLSRSGIASVRFDFRGSGDSEGAFQKMTLSTQVSDAQTVFSMIEKHPQLDESRVGILGKSLGGVVGVLTAQEIPFIRSVAQWASPFGAKPWAEQLLHKLDQEDFHKNIEFNGVVIHQELIKEFVTLNIEEALSQIQSKPFLSIHGERDSSVHPEHQQHYIRKREGAEGETRTLLLPSSDHDFGCVAEQEMLLSETLKWFQETL